MDEPPGNEPQHIWGMPIEPDHSFPHVGETEQRVLGIPRSWYRTSTVDLTGFHHPVRWLRWRIKVHRHGPYAPNYEKATPETKNP